MKFYADINSPSVVGEIRYSISERSFDFIPHLNSDISLLVGYVNIGIDSDEMSANQVWGFAPKESWVTCTLKGPCPQKGRLVLLGDYDSGCTWRIDKVKMWRFFYDAESQWLCIGNPDIMENQIQIEFLNNVVAILSECGELQSLWVKPNYIN